MLPKEKMFKKTFDGQWKKNLQAYLQLQPSF